MDIRKLLEKDHRDVESLFASLEKADHSDADGIETLCRMLEVHAEVEESLFYPALEKEGSDLIDDARREHEEMKSLIAEIRDAKNNGRADLVTTLQQAVEGHVAEEENEIFPSAGKLLGTMRLQEIGEEAMEMKERMLAGTRAESEDMGVEEGEEVDTDADADDDVEETGEEAVVTGEHFEDAAKELEEQRHPDESLEEPAPGP